MKAIGFRTSLPVSDSGCFVEFEMEKPKATGRDLLVRIEAIAVNPVDYKVRQNSARDEVLETPKIIGWDACGIVESVGDQVQLFQPGDSVFYAGVIDRTGCNAEYQLVDERIVGRAPDHLTSAETAAIPLTALTAWELFFDRMRIEENGGKDKTLLIIGGAGGVGSIAIQLAKKLTQLKVIATASRSETTDWCYKLGADLVVNHYELLPQLEEHGCTEIEYIADLVNTNYYWDAMVELIAPQGHIGSITGSSEPIAINKLKSKSVSFSWEFMYTRPMFKTNDMIRQHEILNRVGEMLSEGLLNTTLNTTLKGLTVDNLRKAHEMLEGGKTIGKIVLNLQ